MPSHVPIPTTLRAPGEADIRRRRSQEIHTHKMERNRKKQASQTEQISNLRQRGRFFLDAHKKKGSFANAHAHLDLQAPKYGFRLQGEKNTFHTDDLMLTQKERKPNRGVPEDPGVH